MIKKTFILLSIALLFYPIAVNGREPAANVLIISEVFEEEGFPALCKGIVLHGNTIFVTDYLRDMFVKKGNAGHKDIIIEPGLEYLEDASRILIVQTEKDCRLFISELSLPPPAVVSLKSNIPLEIDRWIANTDGELLIIRENNAVNIQKGKKNCIVKNRKGKCSYEIYNYGILPIYFESFNVKSVRVKIEDSFSNTFFGPGDRQLFDVEIPSAGTLVIEYRTEAGTGMLDSRIFDKKGKSIGTGSGTFSEPQTARVELSYRGGMPSGYDIGFMFIPYIPLACTIEITPGTKPGEAGLMLVVKNITGGTVIAPLPEAGTVRWYADGRLISAASPGRPPRYHSYQPGERLSYQIALPANITNKKIKAEMDADKYRVSCEVVPTQ